MLFTFGVILVTGIAWYLANNFSSRGQWFPLGLASIACILGIVQFLREGFGAKTGSIMDIGIRSAGQDGARSAGLIVAGFITGMVVLSGLIGLQYAAIFVALLGPPAIMGLNRTGIIGGLVGGGLIFLINWLFFGGIFGSTGLVSVIWPDTFILDWFRD
jgi:hypothetical protein